jgi:hypothetical protein
LPRGRHMEYVGNMGKDENIAFRTSPEVKEILDKLARAGYRSLSQQCEMIIIEWLKAQGYVKGEEGPVPYPQPGADGPQVGAMVHEPVRKYKPKRGK